MQVSATEPEEEESRDIADGFLTGPVAHRALSRTIEALTWTEPHCEIPDTGWRLNDQEIVFTVTYRRNGAKPSHRLWGVQITEERIRINEFDQYLVRTWKPEDLDA